jgi:uncharacterized protein (DUF2126 family)
MIARFDHRPMLTAALALSTIVLFVVVVTLSTLLITVRQAATPSSVSDGGNAGAAAPANMHSGVHDQAGERHHKMVGDYLPADSPLRDK